MRKIISNLFISLDGVVEEPGDWHFPYFNDEMGAAVDAVLGAQGLGKVPECLVHVLVMPRNSRTPGVLAICQSRLTASLLSG